MMTLNLAMCIEGGGFWRWFVLLQSVFILNSRGWHLLATHSNFHGFFFFPWLLRRARFGSSWCHICVFKASLIPISMILYEMIKGNYTQPNTAPRVWSLHVANILLCAFFPLKGALCVHRLGRVASFGKQSCFTIWYKLGSMRTCMHSFRSMLHMWVW